MEEVKVDKLVKEDKQEVPYDEYKQGPMLPAELPPTESPPKKEQLPSLHEVISATEIGPEVILNIVNPESNFVVVTYWWGRDNLNGNTARPCISFYEDLFKRVVKVCINTLVTINQLADKPKISALEGQVEEIKTELEEQVEDVKEDLEGQLIDKPKISASEGEVEDIKADLEEHVEVLKKDFEGQLDHITKISPTYKLLKMKTEEYYNEIYSYLKFATNSKQRCKQIESTKELLEKLKEFQPPEETGKTPKDYVYRSREDTYMLLLFITTEFIRLNKADIIRLYEIKMEIADIKSQYLNREKPVGEVADKQSVKPEIDEYKKKLNILVKEKNELDKKIKLSPKTKNVYEVVDVRPSDGVKSRKELLNNFRVREDFQNKSLNEILVQELRYLNPLKFQDMLKKWGENCEKNKCNYMSVEYPRFTQDGGYQMAINAKPMFIQKCLELCAPRSVLYIDGDMNIRKYPKIFDLPGIDYMARGWHMDPRSNLDQLDESITYDPYSFETSGGTMFFANSEESKELLKLWISTSDSPYQVGKADDRIISLIVNSRKLLLKMKIFQLPIEYLWLTLRYNDTLTETETYNYDFKKLDASIFIDHPECLTSEDTASSSGSSSDRTPRFYGFIEENMDPVSEEFFEHLAFPDKSYVEGVQMYHDFMRETYYLDDGNTILYEKKLVKPGRDTAENEQPLYIIDFDKKYGASRNELSEAIISRSTTMATEGLYEFDEENNLAVIVNGTFTKGPEEDNKPDTTKILALIYKLLSEGKDVLYNPKPPENGGDAIYKEFIANREKKYKNTEFAFVPIFKQSSKYNDIYRPKIDLTDCIYFSSKCEFIKKFLTMFESLDDMSNYINYGSYQLISSVRVSYLVFRKEKSKKVEVAAEQPSTMVGGGCEKIIDFREEYLKAIEMPIDVIQNAAGKKYIKRSRKRVRFSNKRSRKQRK